MDEVPSFHLFISIRHPRAQRTYQLRVRHYDARNNEGQRVLLE